jgi:hypothetical protein
MSASFDRGGRPPPSPPSGRELAADSLSYYVHQEDDGLTVTYTGHAVHSADFGVARTAAPFAEFVRGGGGGRPSTPSPPPSHNALAYFEARVHSASAESGCVQWCQGRRAVHSAIPPIPPHPLPSPLISPHPPSPIPPHPSLHSSVTVGLVSRHHNMHKAVGSDRLSAGIVSDGRTRAFIGLGPKGSDTYAPRPVGSGDVLGCGFVPATGELFFTHNGEKLPPAYFWAAPTPSSAPRWTPPTPALLAQSRARAAGPFGLVPPPSTASTLLYPAVSLHARGDRVSFILDGPFAFDVDAYLEARLARRSAAFLGSGEGGAGPPHLPPQLVPAVVLDFALHYGYAGTVAALLTADGCNVGERREHVPAAAAAAAAAPAALSASVSPHVISSSLDWTRAGAYAALVETVLAGGKDGGPGGAGGVESASAEADGSPVAAASSSSSSRGPVSSPFGPTTPLTHAQKPVTPGLSAAVDALSPLSPSLTPLPSAFGVGGVGAWSGLGGLDLAASASAPSFFSSSSSSSVTSPFARLHVSSSGLGPLRPGRPLITSPYFRARGGVGSGSVSSPPPLSSSSAAVAAAAAAVRVGAPVPSAMDFEEAPGVGGGGGGGGSAAAAASEGGRGSATMAEPAPLGPFSLLRTLNVAAAGPAPAPSQAPPPPPPPAGPQPAEVPASSVAEAVPASGAPGELMASEEEEVRAEGVGTVPFSPSRRPKRMNEEGEGALPGGEARSGPSVVPAVPTTVDRARMDLLAAYGYGLAFAATSPRASSSALESLSGPRRHSIAGLLSFEDVAAAKGRTLHLRGRLRGLIFNGSPQEAVDLLASDCPSVLAYPPHAAAVGLVLHALEVIDAAVKGDVDEALALVETHLAPFLDGHRGLAADAGSGDESPAAAALNSALVAHADADVLDRCLPFVREVVGLLAYPFPASPTCPLAHLVHPATRDAVADVVNAAVLERELAVAASAALAARSARGRRTPGHVSGAKRHRMRSHDERSRAAAAAASGGGGGGGEWDAKSAEEEGEEGDEAGEAPGSAAPSGEGSARLPPAPAEGAPAPSAPRRRSLWGDLWEDEGAAGAAGTGEGRTAAATGGGMLASIVSRIFGGLSPHGGLASVLGGVGSPDAESAGGSADARSGAGAGSSPVPTPAVRIASSLLFAAPAAAGLPTSPSGGVRAARLARVRHALRSTLRRGASTDARALSRALRMEEEAAGGAAPAPAAAAAATAPRKEEVGRRAPAPAQVAQAAGARDGRAADEAYRILRAAAAAGLQEHAAGSPLPAPLRLVYPHAAFVLPPSAFVVDDDDDDDAVARGRGEGEGRGGEGAPPLPRGAVTSSSLEVLLRALAGGRARVLGPGAGGEASLMGWWEEVEGLARGAMGGRG